MTQSPTLFTQTFYHGRERIYLVEATGAIENDPDLTDKKFPAIQQNLIANKSFLRLLAKFQFGKYTQ